MEDAAKVGAGPVLEFSFVFFIYKNKTAIPEKNNTHTRPTIFPQCAERGEEGRELVVTASTLE